MKYLVPALLLAVPLALAIGPAGLDPAVAWALRAPRVAGALAGGAALALAGVCMQTLLRNPLAEPFVLGMSGGASLGAVAAVLVVPLFPPALAGAIGALASAMLVASLARGADGLLPPTRLVLSGVAVAAVLGAVTGFLLQVASRSSAVRAALYWTSGGLGGAAWPAVSGTATLALLVAVGVWRHAGSLDRMLLGEEVAASMGVPVPRVRAALLIAGAALTGAVVALGGAIGFVGLVAPHLGRMLAGSTHRRLLPAAAALGALLLLAADTLARTAFAPRELPAGVLTAVLGGPFFLALLRRRTYAFAEAA